MKYINKGKRNFNIIAGGKAITLRPFEVIELTDKEYNIIKGFKEIEVIKEHRIEKEEVKEEVEEEVKTNNRGRKKNGEPNNIDK